MIYARFGRGGSDVYVYQRADRAYVCHACPLDRSIAFEDVAFASADGILEHLLAHRAAGYSVPQDAIDVLAAEASATERRAKEGDDGGS